MHIKIPRNIIIFLTLKVKIYYITCPTNIFPATLSDSVGEVPIVICIIQEICRNRQNVHRFTHSKDIIYCKVIMTLTLMITHCITPRKYSTDIMLLKNITIGKAYRKIDRIKSQLVTHKQFIGCFTELWSLLTWNAKMPDSTRLPNRKDEPLLV